MESIDDGFGSHIPRVTPEDVRRIVARDFPESSREAAWGELKRYTANDTLRVQLAALKCANGNLKTLAPLSQGQRTPAVLGSVGDAMTPGAPSLYLDVRRPREGVELHASSPETLLQPTQTISVDPRNVLERRQKR